MTDKELLSRIVALLSTQTAQLERIASACERCEMRTLKADGGYVVTASVDVPNEELPALTGMSPGAVEARSDVARVDGVDYVNFSVPENRGPTEAERLLTGKRRGRGKRGV